MAKVGNGGGGSGGKGGGSLAITGITPDSGFREDGMTNYGGMISFLKAPARAIGLALLIAGPAWAASIENPPGAVPIIPPGAARTLDRTILNLLISKNIPQIMLVEKQGEP